MEIMVLKGDGIGPEIMESSLNILNLLTENYNLKIDPVEFDIGAETISTGKWKLPAIIEEARKFKAILKAPMGHPELRNAGGTEDALDVILGLRSELDLYANVRPVKKLPGVQSVLRGYDEPGSINYTLIRENSEGLYSSHFGGQILRDEVAVDNQIITRKGTERISKYAFELAEKNYNRKKENKKKVTCVDKSNVLKSFVFFRKIFEEVSKDYPGVETQYMYADAMTQYMLFHPRELDVIVTENMFGDVLSDLAAATVGGLGFAYSANLSENTGMFEPVHGSAVDIAGKGIANPTAMILSTTMMLGWLGEAKYSDIVEKALSSVLADGTRTADMGGNTGTKEFTEKVMEKLRNS